MLVWTFVAFAVTVRLIALAISVFNERKLRGAGAKEFGARTSKAIATAHVVFYLAAIAEGAWRDAPCTWLNGVGLAVYVLSICVLLYVMVTLGRLWTVKIMLAPDHRLVTNWLFRRVRHPNYFLNIIPELIGFALVLNAWTTLAIGVPVYVAVLLRRIRQEERVMRRFFPQY